MPKYVIEREIPGVGDWSAEQLRGLADLVRRIERDGAADRVGA